MIDETPLSAFCVSFCAKTMWVSIAALVKTLQSIICPPDLRGRLTYGGP